MEEVMQNIVSDAMNSVLIWTVGGLVFTFVLIVVLRRAFGPNKKLLQQGLPGRATVMNVYQTGMMVNNNPQIIRPISDWNESGYSDDRDSSISAWRSRASQNWSQQS